MARAEVLALHDLDRERREREEREALCADGVLDVKAAAAFLAIGRSGLYALIREGALPVVRIGRSSSIPRRALVKFLAAHLVIEGGG
jgi:excisionase family DNA binding protein